VRWDLGFLCGMLIAVALPLIALRESPFASGEGSLLEGRKGFPASTTPAWAAALRGPCYLLAAVLALAWVRGGRGSRYFPGAPPAGEAVAPARPTGGWRLAAWTGGLLLALVLVAYGRPLLVHFWGGYDEFVAFEDICARPWSDVCDRWFNRPLTGWSYALAQLLTPGRVEGYLVVAVALCFANAWLLFTLVRGLLPAAGKVAAAAAVLLVVSRAEPSRFFVLWTACYYNATLFLLLLSLWAFWRSYERQQRGLLLLACATLGGALLASEGVLPLAMLSPVCLWLRRRDNRGFAVWACAWCGTAAVLVARFAVFLRIRGGEAYQAQLIATVLGDPSLLLHCLGAQLSPFLTYFEVNNSLAGHGLVGLCALALAALLLALPAARAPLPWPRRQQLLALGLAALAVLLGIAPFVYLPSVFRTQFFSAPAQAALLAVALGLVVRFLPARLGRWALVGAVGLLAGNATVATWRSQESARANADILFEKTVHVFQQVHAFAPRLPSDTLILYFLDEDEKSPLGANYALARTSLLTLGVPAVLVNGEDASAWTVRTRFTRTGVAATDPFREYSFRYDQLVAFRLAADGSVSLLRQLPEGLLPEGSQADRYDPLARAGGTPTAPLRFLHYLAWSQRPLDVVPVEDGVLLGAGWSALKAGAGEVSREAANDAELVVNPRGCACRALDLDLEPAGSPGAPRELQVLAQDGRVVARTTVTERQAIHLSLPTNPQRPSVFQLRLLEGGVPVSSGPDGVAFRVYRRGEGVVFARPTVARQRDVVGQGLRVGDHWYPLEEFGGLRFRWVNNDAELCVGLKAVGDRGLLLDLEPGPGLGGEPCRLSVRDRRGGVLATACVRGRETVRLPLPAAPGPGAKLYLHVEGGGRPTPNDPRRLNFRVFDCRWAAQ
jgi:hypothetical protein